MKTELIKRYGGSVPRYTSYPTAPHFHDRITDKTYASWLQQLPAGTPTSLYLHVPFCREMCWYCGCFTKIVNRYDPVSTYLETLLKEIDLVSRTAGDRLSAKFIHWGGGSPTILSGDDWKRTMARLRSRFELPNDAEVAVEMDPRTTDPSYVAALAESGVNRVSIGVQDFDKDVQEAINRVQPYDITKRVVDWLRDAGINDINLDLMYGLPHQDEGRVLRMTERALELQPSRIALFGYAHVPWMKKHQRLIPENALPDAEARWDQAERCAELLVERGYVRIGLDHFAHPDDDMAKAMKTGSLHRNFQGYTTDNAPVLLGFGASAIGSLPDGYVQNTTSIRDYTKLVDAGTLPIFRGIELTTDDRARREMITRLMCDLSVDIAEISQIHDIPLSEFDEALSSIAPMIGDGLVERTGHNVSVTTSGRPLVRQVAAAFDSYLAEGKARHSAAV